MQNSARVPALLRIVAQGFGGELDFPDSFACLRLLRDFFTCLQLIKLHQMPHAPLCCQAHGFAVELVPEEIFHEDYQSGE